MTTQPAPTLTPTPARSFAYLLEAALAGIAAVISIGLATSAVYYYGSAWLPAMIAWPNPAAALNATGLAALAGVLGFFYGLEAVIKQRLVLGLGFAWRERRGGLTGMAAVAAGAGGAAGGLLLVSAAAVWLMPDLSLGINTTAAVLAGLVAMTLGWGAGQALRRLGY
jgi:hypothetical protein